MSIETAPSTSSVHLEQLPLVTYASSLDPRWTVDYVSPQIEAMLGFAASDWTADPDFWLGRVVPEDKEAFLTGWGTMRERRASFSAEYRMLARDGRRIWVRDTAAVVTDEDGTMSLHGFLTDITREKELESALAHERAQTDAFFRDSPVGMAITDPAGRFVRVNEALARMNGISVDEHVGRRLREINPLVDAMVEPLLAEVRRTGVALHGRELSTVISPDETVTSLVSYFPVEASDSTNYGGVVIDVSELHRALAERAEAEHKYRRLIEQLPLVTYVNTLGPEWRCVYVSPQIEELFGHPPSAWLEDRDLWDSAVHPDDLPGVLASEAEARSSGTPVEFEYRIVRADGTVRWVLDMLRVAFDESGAPLHEQGFLIDITARKRAEEEQLRTLNALGRSEEKFRAVFDDALDAMVVADDDGCYVDVNPAACVLFGRTREELLAMSVADVSSRTSDTQAAWDAFLEAGVASGAYVIVRRDGSERDVEFAARANVREGHHLSVLRDVTERKQLEASLSQAQKLDSVGTLAGGVAHDFNNMLTAIRGYSQLLLGRLPPESKEHGHAAEIERAADRATKLTAQLLAFGRRQILQPQFVDVNALVADLMPTLLRVGGTAVELAFHPAEGVGAVKADPGQLEQVIMNIVANAVDAMPGGGRVTITTRAVELECGRVDEPPAGGYIELSITDSGQGMPAEMLDQVFEPFFTTKEVGQGDGLGLSTAYGIVKQSGGDVVVESNVGAGSTFRVLLPVAA